MSPSALAIEHSKTTYTAKHTIIKLNVLLPILCPLILDALILINKKIKVLQNLKLKTA